VVSGPVITPARRGYRGLATDTSLDLRVGYDPTHDSFWARIHTRSDQLLLERTGLADTTAVERAVLGWGQVPGVVLSWLDRDRERDRNRVLAPPCAWHLPLVRQ
jgi:hypothetical protein